MRNAPDYQRALDAIGSGARRSCDICHQCRGDIQRIDCPFDWCESRWLCPDCRAVGLDRRSRRVQDHAKCEAKAAEFEDTEWARLTATEMPIPPDPREWRPAEFDRQPIDGPTFSLSDIRIFVGELFATLTPPLRIQVRPNPVYILGRKRCS